MSKHNVYHSFAEWAKAEYDIEYEHKKVEAQREKVVGFCPYCKQPCQYKDGTNIVVCVNEKCKGKKIKTKGGDIYKPFYKILSDEETLMFRN